MLQSSVWGFCCVIIVTTSNIQLGSSLIGNPYLACTQPWVQSQHWIKQIVVVDVCNPRMSVIPQKVEAEESEA